MTPPPDRNDRDAIGRKSGRSGGGVKIIFVNRFFYPDVSATSRMTTELAEGLSADFDVHVITSRQLYENARADLLRCAAHGKVSIHRVRSSGFGRARLTGRALDYASFYASAFRCLLKTARRGDVIIAETDPPLISVAAAWAARLKGAHLVNWVQDLFPEIAEALGVLRGRGLRSALLKRLRNASLRAARTNVVLGGDMAERVRAEAGSVPVTVIHNWADGSQVRPLEASADRLRQEWGLADPFIVAYSGNLGRAHDLDTVLAAAERLRERKSVIFLFIGGGFHWKRLQAAVREKGLTNVLLKPYQSEQDLSESLGAADAHLVTLRPEAESLVVPSKFYGILAAGRPAIYVGRRQSELAALLAQSEAGLCAETAQDLAESIARLSGDLDSVRRMGLNARKLFESRFERRIALRAWKGVIERCT